VLPFDAEVLASFFTLYNRAVWPAQILAVLLALAALWFCLSPRHGGGRVPGLLLAAGWLWCGAVFFLQHFARLDFMAPVYGWVFILQGVLLLWSLGWRRGVLRFRASAFGWAGLALAVFALLGLPAISALTEAGWQSARIVGLAPGSTAVFTLGLLLLGEGRPPWHLLLIPLLWTGIAGATGWSLTLPEELPLPIIGVAALALCIWKHRRAA